MQSVNVTIPCYNGAEYISESIEYVLAQSMADLALIVVYDGSSCKFAKGSNRND